MARPYSAGMATIRSVVTDPSAPGSVILGERPRPEPATQEQSIRVHAFSLNRGELNMATNQPAGSPIGWDVAGELSDGTRVVAFCAAKNGWAEEVVVPENAMAPIPEGISFETACSLPVAAGTALACIDVATGLLGRRALITGITGGVGGFAVQLAKLAGAQVTAQVRTDAQTDYARTLGADEVVVTTDGNALEGHGPYRLVVDGIGGSLLKAGLARLEADGVGVSYGLTGAGEVALPIGLLLGKGARKSARAQSVRGLGSRAPSDLAIASALLGSDRTAEGRHQRPRRLVERRAGGRRSAQAAFSGQGRPARESLKATGREPPLSKLTLRALSPWTGPGSRRPHPPAASEQVPHRFAPP